MNTKHINTLSSIVLSAILALAVLPQTSVKAAGEVITSTATGGGWDDPTTWVGGVVPDSVDDSVVIATTDGATVVLNSATTVKGSLTINAGAELTTYSFALTLEGDFVNNGIFDAGSSNITITGTALSQSIAGFSTGGNVSMTKTAGVATLTGNVSAAGLTLNGLGGTLNLGVSPNIHTFTGTWTRTNGTLEGGSSTIRLSGALSGSTGTFTPGTSTFIYNGTTQNIANLTYHNLKMQGNGVKTALGDITVNGYLRIESSSNFTIGAFSITVTGNTYVTGTLTHNSPTGTKTYNGLVTINPGGVWKNDATGNADIHFRGGLTYNGATFSAGAGVYYFETNNQTIGGSSLITISKLDVASGIILTNNSAGLTVSTILSGAGTITQGASGVLNIGMVDASFTLTTLNASALGNTVNYSYGGAQTVKDIQYHHLTLSTSGAKTLPVGLTHLTGNLSLSGSASAVTLADLDIDGNLSIANSASLTVGAFNFNVDGTTSITGTATSTNGKLIFGSATGAKSFVGAVTVGLFGIWDNTNSASITFEGGLSFSGKTFTSGSGIYTFQTTASQAIGGSAALSIANLTIGAGVNLTNNNTGGLSVSTALAGTGTLTQGASGLLNIGASAANFTLSTLVADAAGNTVNYSFSGAQTVRAVTYHHLTLSGSGSKSLTGLTTVNGNLSLSGTATATTAAAITVGGNLSIGTNTSLTVVGFDFTVNGTTTVTGTGQLVHNDLAGNKLYIGLVTVNGVWSNTGDSAITFRNGLSYGGTTFTAGNGVYTFDTTAAQTIDGTISIPNLTVASGVTLTNDGTITVSTALSGLGTWVQGTTGVLNIGGTSSVTTLTASASGNTVKYNGGSPQTVIGTTYHNLELSGASVKTLPAGLTTVNGNLTLTGSGTSATLAADLTIGGNLTVNTGTTLDVSTSNHAVNVGGNWNATGAFTSRSGTVTLQGSSAQTVNNGSNSFYNLTLNNTAGATLATNNPTVNNLLTLTSGKITTNTRTLIVGSGGSISGASASSYVNGNLQKVFATSGSPQSFMFAVGDATTYSPIDLTVDSVSTGGSLTAKTTAGEHPNIATVVGLNLNKDVNRYWTITPASIIFSTYSATFNFVAGDLDSEANTSIFVVKRYNSSSAGWNSTTAGTRTATSTQAVSIPYTTSSNVYSFAVGEGDDTPPTVTNVTSSTANGFYNAPDVISGITVTFSEPVDVTGMPQLTLETGVTDAVLDYASGSGTDTLTFSNYTVLAGDTSADLDASLLALNLGTIEDASNNAATLTLAGTSLATNKNIVIDTTAPDTQVDTGPASLTNSTSAAFTYSANETSTFECQVDSGGYGACASPYTVAEGLHTFYVRATDLAGNVDATPASHVWTVDISGATVVSSVRVHASPTAQSSVKFTVTFSEPVTGVDITDFSLTLTTVTGATVTAVTPVSATVYTVTATTGTGNGTIRLNVLDNDSILDAALNPQNGAFMTGDSYIVNKTLTYKSVSTNDGWVLESTATSNAGGSINSTTTTFNLGDDASKKQYRGILHFDTSGLPDNAVITSVTLKILKSTGGSGNTSTLGALLADMRKTFFGTNATLQNADFQATAHKSTIFNAFTIAGNWYSATLKAAGIPYINKTGTTQFRLRFTNGDDGDGTADYLKFYSGNASSASRPQLIIQYYVPMP